jgi:tetratricopeptide (TPR) repeat protein
LILAGCLALTLSTGHAQKSPASEPADSARTLLAEEARALEARGRPDMAIQLWQQILLSTPDNAQALAALARDYKLAGNDDKANQTLDRLRRVSPRNPEITRIEGMSSTSTQSDQLRHAGELSRQGRNDDAMRIYRQLYGDAPPNGDIALAYYETLYGSTNGKAPAVAGMRALVDRNPGDPRYVIQLGIMLTYDERTRAEGIRILQAHSNDPAAQSALRQALVWNAANPASAAQLRQYLGSHPNDTALAARLKQNEAKLAQMNSGIARTPAERAAFAALNSHRISEAEQRFNALLLAEPNNGRVLAGMGFLRMQQKNFAAAITCLTEARQNGYKTKIVDDALTTSRFWNTMSEAAQAVTQNQFDLAAAKYRAASAMNPHSPDALNGLAGVYLRQKQYMAAASVFEQLITLRPASFDGWRGLFLADALAGKNDQALALSARMPAAVRPQLDKDPDYLGRLAAIYQAQGRTGDAERILKLALALPFPGNGSTLEAGTKMQYAGILMQAKRYPQAAALYSQVLANNPDTVSGWVGLISAHHELGLQSQALSEIQRMPPAIYESALGDSGFLSLLAAIYQQANQFDVAQQMLERAQRLDTAAGKQPGVNLQLQLAGIYLLRNNTAQAYDLYHQVLTAHPDNAIAWKGLISTLAATNRDAIALQEITQIPAPVLQQLNTDIDFIQIEASLFAATGETTHAVQFMNRVQAYYAKQKSLPPPNIDIANAWLLYNLGDDRALYSALMRLGGRTDLSVAQRETVQNIWANWSVRRAAAAMDNGNVQRAVDILDAASQAFPKNLAVRKAVAGGFARVGRAKEALAVYKTIPMEDATVGDFEGAIGAALAANDRNQAELWLRQALARYAHDPVVLELAARYEQARGDNERAAEYYRASIAAMPSVTPVDRLAHELVYPEQDLRTHRAVTAADLQRLLNPDDEPFLKTTRLPPLPAYGPDPYDGSVPTVLPQVPSAQPAPQTFPAGNSQPDTHDLPPPIAVPHSSLEPSPYGRAVNQGAHIVLASWTIDRPRFGSQPAAIRASSFLPAAIQSAAPPSPSAQPAVQPSADTEITLNPPHSLASDAWKGLVFSLMASNRNAEALAQLSRIPVPVRRQLESDIEWVQGVASLYFSVGDTVDGKYYLKRVQNFYLLHRGMVPAGLELQRAWLLYNVKSDAALYPVLTSLDARTDLTADQRRQLQSIWANWAIRRANDDIDNGQITRGVQILEAVFEDLPDNLDVRFAVAGEYLRVGRAPEALALYKSIPMTNASSADYQGAIGSALTANDMAQAEVWLRVALNRFSNDPNILGLAAHYEQARGNVERATEYMRAAVAATPPGASTANLQTGIASAYGGSTAPAPGETKRLLNPSLDRESTAEQLAPLPSFKSESSAPPSAMPQPASNPNDPSYTTEGKGITPPVYVPQGTSSNSVPSGAVLVPQRNAQSAIARAPRNTPPGELPPPSQYTGRVSLPPSEATVNSVPGPLPEGPGPENAKVAPPNSESQISSSLIHPVPNAPVNPPGGSPAPTAPPFQVNQSETNMAQYTPSAQDAATGAFSAPQQQPTAQPPPAAAPAPAQPKPAPTTIAHRKKPTPSEQAPQPPEQTLGNAPIATTPAPGTPTVAPALPPAEAEQSTEAPEQAPTEAPSAAPATDQQLEQQNLPPLRGSWNRIQRMPHPPSPREEAEQQLASIESGYSGWLGGTSLVNYRSGAPGYSQLAAIESPFEASAPLGYHARITVIARPVFLDSGQANGSNDVSVQESQTGTTCLVTIPQPIGTAAASQNLTPCTAPTIGALSPPAQQNAFGLGGELQLAFPHLAIAGGYTPSNFLVSTFTARLQWRPANGPVTLSFVRDSETDSQLSFAGLRDPGQTSPTNPGQIWGGVVYNQGLVQIAHGDAQSGFYFTAGGQYLTGSNVKKNDRIDGTGGAYWRAYAAPEFGNLTIGANFFAMHYQNNQNAFTHGMGGYFSPQAYFLGNIPVTWTGHYLTHLHYNITGAIGAQAFQEDATPLWPLAADKALETSQNNPMLPNVTSVSVNYDFRSQAAYQIGPHWFAGAYLNANNTRNYSYASVGFFVRYTFRQQPSAASAPTGLFPAEGLRPFNVP